MIHFFAADLAHNWQWLKSEKNSASEKAANQDKPTQMDINRLNGLFRGLNRVGGGGVQGLSHFCNLFQMDKSTGRIEHFRMLLNVTNATPSFQVIHSELLGIENCLWKEMQERTYLFVSQSKARLMEPFAIFGTDVPVAFPTAKEDMRDAGNCLAYDLHTAAVFHLMRVAEAGLRAIAKTPPVKVRLKFPLEYADWGMVITKLDAKLSHLNKTKRGAKKSAELEFYSNAVSDCRAFKETYRDCVMHARNREFTEAEAMGVYVRVRDFMQRLAEKGLRA